MLVELTIENIVVIDRAVIKFGEGLTAITGETGAGKSVLLEALRLLTGAKADRGLVRRGTEAGTVTGVFELPLRHAVWTILSDVGIPFTPHHITLRRVLTADGRSKAYVNDHPCAVHILRRLGGELVGIHGQNEHLEILKPVAQREFLDRFGRLDRGRGEVRRAWRLWRDAEAARLAHHEACAVAARDRDYLEHVADELAAIDIRVGEEARLAERRASLMAAERVAGELDTVLLTLENEPARSTMGQASAKLLRALERLPAEEAKELREGIARLDAAMEEFSDAQDALARTSLAYAYDPDEVAGVEERLFAIRAASRKFGRSCDELPAFRLAVEKQLSCLGDADATGRVLDEAAVKGEAAYLRAAELLSQKRRRSAKRLAKAMQQELEPLHLGAASFEVEINTDGERRDEAGMDAILFRIMTNVGGASIALSGGVSGGELSRLVLALKSCLSATDTRALMVFDEVDAGVGGAVAYAVGERLARMALHRQVLVVTHSPQVAARVDTHLRVEKASKSVACTSVDCLSADERVEEIARMLSGAAVNTAARAAALTLLFGDDTPKMGSATVQIGAKQAA